ncbi:putative inner kinetochore subunit [Kosakonia phage Kc263]|uniref:Inner kinetochore subunit n=1 Tax=Kosakonia phage Kc263 TaxID=2863194 RepID=A0AAE7WFM0_9CAUD|nr:putative inner kinetochore subunit [Kosakonia phage Kc263]QYN79980.1 putative inner kinetochore subunit [Kosakonia phage Kc263]
MIANADNYLLLKQLMVVLQTLRLNGQIKTGEGQREVTVDSTIESITRLIDQIEQDFTIPYVMIRNISVAFDMSVFIQPLSQLQGMELVQGTTADALATVKGPEAIERVINDFPVMGPTIQLHKENVEQGQFWGSSRSRVGDLIQITSSSLRSLQYWAERADDKSLEQILLLINMVELVDRTFAFFNDYYGAENGDPERRETE